MMRYLLIGFGGLLLVFVAISQSDFQAPICSNEISDECQVLGASAFAENRPQQAYDYNRQGCDYNLLGSCSQLYPIAKMLGPRRALEAENYLYKRCSENEEICDQLAHIYFEENRSAEALAVERKYYLKTMQGLYPFHLYQLGQKTEAYKLALTQCDRNPNECVFYIRAMPDHPQIGSLLAGAEKNCRAKAGQSSGATNCALLGSYFYAQKNFSKAFAAWDLECQKNVGTPCLLILGSSADPTSKLSAYRSFCLQQEISAHESGKPKIEECNNTHAAKIPAPLLKQSHALLQSYLNEK